jgi:hypothetical protein
MFEEETDQYFIHSDIFSSLEDKNNDGRFFKHSVPFLILSNENYRKIKIDDASDFRLCRPERIDFNLGI